MHKFFIKGLAAVLGLTLLCSNAAAQEGYPLKGSWIGEWKGNSTHGDFVLVVMDWDGKTVSGMINPGTDNIEIDSAVLDPSDWSVHIMADTEVDGRSLTYEIDATIKNLELPDRSLVGTWKSQAGSGDFEIVRQ